MSTFTDAECEKWRIDPTKNPKTGKKISETGKIYKDLVRKCGPIKNPSPKKPSPNGSSGPSQPHAKQSVENPLAKPMARIIRELFREVMNHHDLGGDGLTYSNCVIALTPNKKGFGSPVSANALTKIAFGVITKGEIKGHEADTIMRYLGDEINILIANLKKERLQISQRLLGNQCDEL